MRKIPEIVQQLKKMEESGQLESDKQDTYINKIINNENLNLKENQTCNTTLLKNITIKDDSPLENFKHDLYEIIKRGRVIFDISPESILFTDEKGMILEANNKFCDWLGYSRNDVINDGETLGLGNVIDPDAGICLPSPGMVTAYNLTQTNTSALGYDSGATPKGNRIIVKDVTNTIDVFDVYLDNVGDNMKWNGASSIAHINTPCMLRPYVETDASTSDKLKNVVLDIAYRWIIG